MTDQKLRIRQVVSLPNGTFEATTDVNASDLGRGKESLTAALRDMQSKSSEVLTKYIKELGNKPASNEADVDLEEVKEDDDEAS
ncbi:hypothetical protein NDN08_006733 [Rhodosorus marinus]|uniref:EKC/KEOPS complex subunit GON7 n=1 Tax=Rhodosorus marinus TaxID=101924 RepID=A0AAV8ULK8_9RHOD|nr:hypothetical protein NDN08_006733 [Rhodosorus marinus]